MADVSQANAGDSRSVLGVKGRAKPLSFDHKPQNEGEFSESTCQCSVDLLQAKKLALVPRAVSSTLAVSTATSLCPVLLVTLNSRRAPSSLPSNRS